MAISELRQRDGRRRANRPGAEEQVGQMEETRSVLDVEDGRFQKTVQLLVEVGIISANR